MCRVRGQRYFWQVLPVTSGVFRSYFTRADPALLASRITNHHGQKLLIVIVQSLSRVQLCDPMGCSTPGFLVVHHLPELLKLMSMESVMPSNHLVLCRPLLLLPSIFPSIRVFSNESALCVRWPKYWSFSFSISPSNEYSGLVSFRIDWFDLLAFQGTLKSSPTPQLESMSLSVLSDSLNVKN